MKMIEHIIGGKSIQRSDHQIYERGVSSDMIAPSKEYYEEPFCVDHTSEPIKNLSDILKVSRFLIENERWRDNMLFIVGINFGLRVSDLRQLRFSDLIDEDLKFKDTFPVFEIKTRNTRKRKKNRSLQARRACIKK
jgi:integrase